MRRVGILVGALALVVAARAQPVVAPGYAHQAWTTAEGLPVDAITDLIQGRDGYLWMATSDGLVRFDGVRFTVFTVATTPGLPSNRLRRLDESRHGLWLSTVLGDLVRFERDSVLAVAPLKLSPWPQRVGDALWTADPSGIYVADVGVRRIGSPPPGNEVLALRRDMTGTLWIATDRGLFRHASGRWRRVSDDGLDVGRIGVLEDDPSSPGRVWVGAEGGLFRTDGGRLVAVPSDLTDVRALIRLPDAELAGYDREGLFVLRDGHVESSATAASGLNWVPTRGIVTDVGGETLVAVGQRLLRDGEVIFDAGAAISAVVRDHEGSLWVATIGRGLHRLRHTRLAVVGEAEGMTSANAYGLAAGASGTLWIGTLGGWIQRLHDGRVTSYSNGPIRTAWTVLEDRAGRLWAGGPAGLWRCHPPALDDTTSPMPCEQTGPTLAGDQTVRALLEDRAGTLWVGTMRGTYRLREGRWSGPILADDWVQAFYEDRTGTLWAATYDGVVRLRDGEAEWLGTAEGLPSGHVRAVYVDAEGVLWVGTEDQGLVRVDVRGGGPLADAPITVFGRQEGLPVDGVHTILDDGAGRFWMSSNQGLFAVRRADLEAVHDGRARRFVVESYDERDGMRSREANGGVQSSALRTADGRLWFSTQRGVVAVDPTGLRRNPIPPPVAIEGVLVGGRRRAIADGAVVLRPGEHAFDVVYTGLSFAAPERMRFRYRLDGLDDGWTEVDRRTAVFTNVPPGRYTFHVTASNDDGVWNETGATLAVLVAPHVWETRWFMVLVAFALAAMAWLALRARLHLDAERARALEALVDERTAALARETETVAAQAEELRRLDAFKSRFFANLSHEFRTPLTLIIGPLQRALAGEHGALPETFEAEGRVMLRNSRRLQRLINQILDLARLESGRQRVDAAPHDLVPFVAELAEAFGPLAQQTGVTLRFEPTALPCPATFDPDLLEKAVLNLLSNAFKATGAGDVVTVTVRCDDAWAEVRVADTGPGIAADALPHLFDRFYQVDSSTTRRQEGTGIGLALAKELVEAQRGSIEVESEVGAGSTFTIRLPAAPYVPGGDGAAAIHAAAVETAGEGEEAAAVAPHAEVGDDEDRTTVLVVEDNADMRAFVRSVLAGDYRVIEAADGAAGLDAAREHLPDLVVSDVMMPEMDGFELNRQLKADPALDAVPVVLLTARAGAEDHVEGYETGADAYVTKPFEADVLRAQVAALLATRRRLRDRFREAPPEASSDGDGDPDTPFVARLRAAVEARLGDPELSVDDLAEAVHLSYSQLNRRLKEDADVTPVQFIRTIRLERAAALLAEGEGSVSEVAYAVGFNSLSYFSRSFRDAFGVPPSAYVADA